MFDAKKLLEAMLGGGQPPAQSQQQGAGDLGDLLGQILGGGQAAQAGPSGGGGAGGVGDVLRRLGEGSGSSPQRNAVEAREGGAQGGGLDDLLRNLGASGGGAPPAGGGGGGGGLGDLLEQLQRQAGGQGGGQGGAQGGGIADILRQVLGQATSGAREGAGRIGEATGAREALERMTGGRSVDDLLGQLKNWIGENQLAAGAAAGGAGAVILGTQTGRRLAGSAAKIGALALIGGLAYKAWQNYSQGKPVLGGQQLLEAPPQGSGFEPQALTGGRATLYIKAMIAAAAADGSIDETEKGRILGSLRQAGVGTEAAEFLELEMQNPATVEDLAGAVSSAEEAAQLYAAARIAIDVDTGAESDFLTVLAQRLNLDQGLVEHVDALAAERA